MSEQIALSIEGMSCQHCVHAVREALEAVPHVRVHGVRIGGATVEVDPDQVSLAALVDAVDDAGYSAQRATP